ncbi:complex I subunit 4 family protein [Urbifossiella limnaea]|uniref:NADH-quinone oxidoreductase subunit M n=1 Tax=Urbifossiella limnaea TaxID=2528023 RepID=A0A517XLQ2_9BACT|nr:NADH-quinone oxidoreductase subunit M [Urbifossiella limnaea]QDU18434.1 NADH-quinone oxidoreductase subunit M [Urbifossiella limnaea]
MYPAFRIIVLLLVAFPLLSALVVCALPQRAARRVALWLALIHVGLTAAVVAGTLMAVEVRNEAITAGVDYSHQRFHPEFVPGDPGLRGSDEVSSGTTRLTLLSLADIPEELAGPRVQLYLGTDGLNVWLVALCSVMMLPAILVSWSGIREKVGGYYAWLFVLQAGAVGAFLSFDVILFYAFFELTLVPAFFLIGRWGNGSGRRDAARKFFLYTLAGSLLTLVGVIGVVLTNPITHVTPAGNFTTYTFALPELMASVQQNLVQPAQDALDGKPEALAAKQAVQFWLFLALMAGFAVKTPIVPFHTWLPAAYNEAPVGVTVLLSALLAKLGTFGILRFVIPLTPDAAVQYGLPVVGTLAAFGIVYGALCAYGQREIKLLVAYSSVSHLGFLVLGLFALNAEGLSGAVLHMVNHGVSTGALFAALAFLVDRYRTTSMSQFGGLTGRFPKFAFVTFVLALASVGLPGLNNFCSEMLMLSGLFNLKTPGVTGYGFAAVAAAGVFLSAWYTLTMLRRVFFEPLREPPATGVEPAGDLNRREVFALGGLAALCLALGLFPQFLLDPMKADVRVLTTIGEFARGRVAGTKPTFEELPPPPPAPVGAPKEMNKAAGGEKKGGGGKGGGGKKGGGKGGPPMKGEE